MSPLNVVGGKKMWTNRASSMRSADQTGTEDFHLTHRKQIHLKETVVMFVQLFQLIRTLNIKNGI